MFIPPKIAIEAYNYALPAESIAFQPCNNRAGSKLLVWDKSIQAESNYAHLSKYLPAGTELFFNNSKVIAARLQFKKARNSSNSKIEIFCLEPSEKYRPVLLAMQAANYVEWFCLVGGAKKWKEPFLIKEIVYGNKKIIFKAEKIKEEGGQYLIGFSWDDETISFSEILHSIGKIPLPPYIQRAATIEDTERYQTTYALEEGSVAAPTAGLHFNKEVFDSLKQKNIHSHFLTLHVGAGTFMPVKSETIDAHIMHAEFMEINKQEIEAIIAIKNKSTTSPIVSVGTTTLRSLETLYWLGVKLHKAKIDNAPLSETILNLEQWEAYHLSEHPLTAIDALTLLVEWMNLSKMDVLFAKTQLMIVPGYRFKIADGLITNFHQPKSTLLLIIAAIVKEQWRNIYQYAIDNQYRFLSYGDGCLFWIQKDN